MSMSLGGRSILILDQAGALRRVSTTRIRDGTTVHVISRGVLPCV
jgi:hypothetical protein